MWMSLLMEFNEFIIVWNEFSICKSRFVLLVRSFFVSLDSRFSMNKHSDIVVAASSKSETDSQSDVGAACVEYYSIISSHVVPLRWYLIKLFFLFAQRWLWRGNEWQSQWIVYNTRKKRKQFVVKNPPRIPCLVLLTWIASQKSLG